MKYAYPMLLIEIPLASTILWYTFTPEKSIMDSAVRKLKVDVAKSGPLNSNQKLSVLVFFFVFIGWVFLSPRIGLGIVALSGVFLYLTFRLIEWNDIAARMNWGIVILFGSVISLGIQMKDTGAANWLAQSFLDFSQLYVSDVSLISWFFSVVLCSVMTNLLSNAATVAVLGPIVLDLGADPIIMGMATSVASAFAYLTIVASPTCMIIHSTGLVKSKDYFKAGWKLFIVSIVLLFLISFLYWPTLS